MEQNASEGLFGLPIELQKIILDQLNDFDAMMLRASSKSSFSLVSKLHPFPKHFVLDQHACTTYFVKIGNVSCMEYLKSLNFFFKVEHAITAVANNHFNVLIYLHQQGCRMDWTIAYEAARAGSLEILKYCLQHLGDKSFLTSRTVCSSAAGAGQLHILKYLHENGYEWDVNSSFSASQSNQMDCFKYLVEEGLDVGSGRIATRSLEMIKYLEEKGIEWKSIACSQAAGDLEMLKWAHEHGAPWSDAVSNAIIHGHLDCLKYMIENGAAANEQFVRKVGSLDVLKYLVEHTNAVFSPEIYSRSVDNKQKDVLEYLPKIVGLQRPKSLGTLAAKSGDLEFLKWCIEEQHYETNEIIYSEGDMEDILDCALESRNLDCVKYVIEKNLQPRLRTHNEYAYGLAHWKSLDIWKYMYNLEQFEISEGMVQNVVGCGNVEVLEWMEQHGAKFNEDHIVTATIMQQLSSMAYLFKKGIKFPVGRKHGNVLCYKYAHEHGHLSEDSFVLGDDADLLHYMVLCGHVILSPDLYHQCESVGHTNTLAYLKQRKVTPTVKSKIKNLFNRLRKK